MEIFDLGNEAERVKLVPVLMQKIQRAFEGGRLDTETAGNYVKVLLPYMRNAMKRAPD